MTTLMLLLFTFAGILWGVCCIVVILCSQVTAVPTSEGADDASMKYIWDAIIPDASKIKYKLYNRFAIHKNMLSFFIEDTSITQYLTYFF